MAKYYFAGGYAFLLRAISNEAACCLHAAGLDCHVLSEAQGCVVCTKAGIFNVATHLIGHRVLMLLEKWQSTTFKRACRDLFCLLMVHIQGCFRFAFSENVRISLRVQRSLDNTLKFLIVFYGVLHELLSCVWLRVLHANDIG